MSEPSWETMNSPHLDIEQQLWKSLDSSGRQRDAPEYTELQIMASANQARSAREQSAAANLKAGRLLQILRKWKSGSRKRAAPVLACSGSTARADSRSAFHQILPLRSCVSMNAQLLFSDAEEGEGIEDAANESFFAAAKQKRQYPQQSARTMSCPKLGSPLGACTPFSSFSLDEQMRYDEESEYLRPPGSLRVNSCGSSPLKLNLAKQASTPKGYVAMYVGEERKRFFVKANVVNHPLFGVLLDKAREEFGFHQQGPLNIPCEIAFFRHIMFLVESNDPVYRNADPATILLQLNNRMAATQT